MKTSYDIHEASLWYGEDLIVFDGLDKAIIGVAVVEDEARVCYSKEKVIQCFMENGMNEMEAVEYAEYNVFDAYLGAKTPIFVDDFFNNLT